METAGGSRAASGQTLLTDPSLFNSDPSSLPEMKIIGNQGTGTTGHFLLTFMCMQLTSFFSINMSVCFANLQMRKNLHFKKKEDITSVHKHLVVKKRPHQVNKCAK